MILTRNVDQRCRPTHSSKCGSPVPIMEAKVSTRCAMIPPNATSNRNKGVPSVHVMTNEGCHLTESGTTPSRRLGDQMTLYPSSHLTTSCRHNQWSPRVAMMQARYPEDLSMPSARSTATAPLLSQSSRICGSLQGGSVQPEDDERN